MLPEPTVFVVDDEFRLRNSLALLLKSAGFHAETYGSAGEFLDRYDTSSGCLVLDVRMEGMTGLELQSYLLRRGCQIPIVFISAYAEVPLVVQAVQDGAIDFLEKPFDDEPFLRAVTNALEKSEAIHRENAWRHRVQELLQNLTPREREVMNLLVAGKHSKEISAELGISAKTVDVHRAKVLKKMQVESVVNLVNLLHRLEVQA